ncbi:hypothetical protein TNCV_3647251 [Trichonephila clavipes]|nr:hypothetical protein TNCV_3647251 [Trichonephila clavipes]
MHNSYTLSQMEAFERHCSFREDKESVTDLEHSGDIRRLPPSQKMLKKIFAAVARKRMKQRRMKKKKTTVLLHSPYFPDFLPFRILEYANCRIVNENLKSDTENSRDFAG